MGPQQGPQLGGGGSCSCSKGVVPEALEVLLGRRGDVEIGVINVRLANTRVLSNLGIS